MISSELTSLGVGIHDIDAVHYFADPCEVPSLTSSGIKRLLTGSPAEFRARHPRLTEWPELLDETTTAKDLGSVVHSAVLGKGAEYVLGDIAQFRNKDGSPAQTWNNADAKRWKEEREAEGKIVLKPEDFARVHAAADAMIRLLQREYGDWPIGESERCIVWQRETSHGPIWCRALVDHLALQHMTVLDPKSTDLPISDRAIQRKAAADMWHIQAAWYLEGIESNHPNLSGRLIFRFPVVEINPPFQARFVDLPQPWIHIARQRIDRAAELFAKCLYGDSWPAYSTICSPQPPQWMLSEFQEEELQP